MKTKILLIIGTALAVIGTSCYAMYSDKLYNYFDIKQTVSDMNDLNAQNNELRIGKKNLLLQAKRIQDEADIKIKRIKGEANIKQIKIDANKKTWAEKNGQLKLLKKLVK